MKKMIATLLILATCLCLPAATKVSAPVEQILLGHVKSSVYMVVSILENVLPFDLDSKAVQSKEVAGGAAPTDVTGLRIGYYSLVTNDTEFSVTVTHDKLVHFGGVPEDGKETEIDYRLYLFTKDKNFKSCLSTGSITLNAADFGFTSGMLAQANRSLYLSLASGTDGLSAGDYESYITIHVVGSV